MSRPRRYSFCFRTWPGQCRSPEEFQYDGPRFLVTFLYIKGTSKCPHLGTCSGSAASLLPLYADNLKGHQSGNSPGAAAYTLSGCDRQKPDVSAHNSRTWPAGLVIRPRFELPEPYIPNPKHTTLAWGPF